MFNTKKPFYKLVVGLMVPATNAFGSEVALQSGMVLSAGIVLKSRKLIEWLLEPLHRLIPASTNSWQSRKRRMYAVQERKV